MKIILKDAGKRFNREWIFRHLNFTFDAGKSYAITGPNGSGKSTFLQVIAASMEISEGICTWYSENLKVETEAIFKHISMATPYFETIEEMTAKEFLHFHQTFKPFIEGLAIEEILKIIGLEKAAEKQIRFYSSGMKQRIKLAQAIFSDVPLILLDEPCSNLDGAGYQLYHQLIEGYCADKLIIISSNDINEYDFCKEQLNILDYK